MTIYGWDMSHYDAPFIGNAIAEGISFVTHKDGGDSNDGEIGAWWSGVKGHRDRLLLGAYWIVYPGNPVGRADAFIARLDSQCPGWRDGPFILQADCEKWGGDPATVPSISEINAFCDRLVERMPKLNPIAYAPEWVYKDRVSGLRYPIWASAYVTGSGGFKALYPGDGAKQWDAYGGKGPSILQYTSSAVIGGQTTSDANAFRGTLEQLTQLLAPGWTDMAVQLNTDDINAVAAATVAALTKQTTLNGPGGQPDGTTSTPVGNAVWQQGIPDGTTASGARARAWQAFENLGAVVSTDVDTPAPPVDPAAVAAALIAAGFNPAALAAALLAAIAEQA